jgi:multidrug efflux pump subunit AcrA (membrane-fusion protein)
MSVVQEIMGRTGLLPVFLAAVMAFSGCSTEGESGSKLESTLPKAKLVKTATVQAQNLEADVEQVGTLTANLKVKVATESGGVIERLLFERGDRVTEGQVLAEIGTSTMRIEVQQAEAAEAVAASQLEKVERGSRPEEIRIAAATLEQAKATLTEAENNFKRMKELHGYNAISNSDYDSAEKAVETARASLNSTREQLELAKKGPRTEDKRAARARHEQAQAALAMAKDRYRKSVLRSPCNGIIAFRKVEEGEVLSPGTVVTQVVDLEKMKIRLSLGEKYIPILDRQKRFSFKVDAIPETTFECRLSFLSPTADAVTRSFPLELLIDEPDPRMADGMTVRVRFPLVDQKKSIKIHSSWLAEENGQIGLFVIDDGKALFKRVTLGSYYEQKVEILSGLNDHEEVITTPAGLKTGDLVRQ